MEARDLVVRLSGNQLIVYMKANGIHDGSHKSSFALSLMMYKNRVLKV